MFLFFASKNHQAEPELWVVEDNLVQGLSNAFQLDSILFCLHLTYEKK